MRKTFQINWVFAVLALAAAFWLTDGVGRGTPDWYRHVAFVGVTLCVWAALALVVFGTRALGVVVRNAWKA